MTLKQKKLAKNLGNSRTLEEAMLKSGYSKSSAHQQTNITKSKSFEEIVETELKDNLVIQTHKDGLHATKIHGTNDNFIEIPDYAVRLKAVELAYRAKGKLREGIQVQGDLNMSVTIVRNAVE